MAKIKPVRLFCMAVTSLASLFWVRSAQAQVVTAAESEGVKLTVYNQNFGVVKDLRTVELKNGINYLRFEDVAAKIDPTSVSFTSLTEPNAVAVQEQNYQYDILSPDTILNKSVGKTVKFKQFLPSGQINELTGVLMNQPQISVFDTNGRGALSRQGLVLKTSDGYVLNPTGQVQLSELPAGMISKPSLLWKLNCNKEGKHKSEISYQTSDINWHCDYVVVANSESSKIDLISWVTLENNCGASFKNATLKLMAGDVHKALPAAHLARAMVSANSVSASAQQFQEESFAEYHLYSLNGKTDVNDKETKQLTLFSANAIPVKKTFIFDPSINPSVYGREGNQAKINVKLEFENKEKNNLGMPMPKGKIRVYEKDKDGALEFIGEDQIDHTAKAEKVRIYIGDAFDIAGEQKETNNQQISSHLTKNAYSVQLRNHKNVAITVMVVEHLYGYSKVTSSSQPFTKKDSSTFEFEVSVPANSDSQVTYETETKY